MSLCPSSPEALFKIGLKPLEGAEWFDLDEEKSDYQAERDRLSAADFEAVFVQEPGSLGGQAEAREMVERNLHDFHGLDPTTGDGPDLLEAARQTQDDMLLLRRDETAWRLTAGSLHFPSSWKLREKFGQSLDLIHGSVPNFGPGSRNAKLMARIFDHLKPDQPLWRLNWSVHPEKKLHVPESVPRLDDKGEPLVLAHNAVLRVERQTLRKLLKTGDILFCVRIYQNPLKTLARTSGALQALDRHLAALNTDELVYKGLDGRVQPLRSALSDLIR